MSDFGSSNHSHDDLRGSKIRTPTRWKVRHGSRAALFSKGQGQSCSVLCWAIWFLLIFFCAHYSLINFRCMYSKSHISHVFAYMNIYIYIYYIYTYIHTRMNIYMQIFIIPRISLRKPYIIPSHCYCPSCQAARWSLTRRVPVGWSRRECGRPEMAGRPGLLRIYTAHLVIYRKSMKIHYLESSNLY